MIKTLEIVVILVICLVLVFKELKPLFAQDKKLFYVYSALLGFTFVLWFLNGLHVKIPSPAQPLKNIITVIFALRG